MIFCETEPLVHDRRGLSKQAEDEQLFVPVLPILDSPCFGFDDGILLWNADSLLRSIEALSIKNESAAGTYLKVEDYIVVVHSSLVLPEALVLIFSN